jgi:hypothetical protein
MFSCRTRGFCPFCHAKQLEEWGEWMRETLLLDVPHRQVAFERNAAGKVIGVFHLDFGGTKGTRLPKERRSGGAWRVFMKRYRAEMKRPEAKRFLELLAALSHQTNLSWGCYCAEETRCHRSMLKALLLEHGADLA